MPCPFLLIRYKSLGQKCIYLIGTQTRDTKPHAILLQSGDVMAMTGASRSAFHGKSFYLH
jgi:alkylated DNA repair protein alkB homolog 1